MIQILVSFLIPVWSDHHNVLAWFKYSVVNDEGVNELFVAARLDPLAFFADKGDIKCTWLEGTFAESILTKFVALLTHRKCQIKILSIKCFVQFKAKISNRVRIGKLVHEV